jgi:hypothetical protein
VDTVFQTAQATQSGAPNLLTRGFRPTAEFQGIFIVQSHVFRPVGNGNLISTDLTLIEAWPTSPRHWSLLYPIGTGMVVFVMVFVFLGRRRRKVAMLQNPT